MAHYNAVAEGQSATCRSVRWAQGPSVQLRGRPFHSTNSSAGASLEALHPILVPTPTATRTCRGKSFVACLQLCVTPKRNTDLEPSAVNAKASIEPAIYRYIQTYTDTSLKKKKDEGGVRCSTTFKGLGFIVSSSSDLISPLTQTVG